MDNIPGAVQNRLKKSNRMGVIGMAYKAKLWLSKRQYLAVLDEAVVIVTLNEKGEEVRWAIFERNQNHEREFETRKINGNH